MKTVYSALMIVVMAVMTGCASNPTIVVEHTTATEDAGCRAALPKELLKADAGNAMAQFKAGSWIASGCGVDNRDPSKGFAMIKQAAEKDLMVANAALALNYTSGTNGAPKDSQKAIASTTRALELWQAADGKGFAKWEKTTLSRAVTNRGLLLKDVDAEAADYCLALELDPDNYVATKNLKIIKRSCK